MRDIVVSARSILHSVTLVLSANPRATLDQIARSAGLSRATLHRAFSSRDELIRAAALDAISAVEAGFKNLPEQSADELEVIEGVAGILVPLGAKFHFLASETWLDSDEAVAGRLACVQAVIRTAVAKARDEGLLDDRPPLEWQLRAFFALVYAGWEAIGSQELVPRDAVRVVVSAFLRGQEGRRDRAVPDQGDGRRRGAERLSDDGSGPGGRPAAAERRRPKRPDSRSLRTSGRGEHA